MTKAVIDTNVLLVANEQHEGVSPECIQECIRRLQLMQNEGTTVIDSNFRILAEYHNKTQPNQPKGVGNVFLKWLLRNVSNAKRVEQVDITEVSKDNFVEFPDQALQPKFDAPDRKFAAVAHAHPHKPTVWQAADCKWIDWFQALQAQGLTIDFLCPEDACRFYRKKFPKRTRPKIPNFD